MRGGVALLVNPPPPPLLRARRPYCASGTRERPRWVEKIIGRAGSRQSLVLNQTPDGVNGHLVQDVTCRPIPHHVNRGGEQIFFRKCNREGGGGGGGGAGGGGGGDGVTRPRSFCGWEGVRGE